MTGAIVTAEPVRGGFPDPAVLGLPGWQQIAAYGTALVPRSPLSRLLGLDMVSVELGRASYRLPLTPWLRDGDGRVSPAVVAVAADAALAGGVVSGLSPGHARLATVDLSLHHHLGADLDGLLDAGQGLVATGWPCGPAGPGLVLAELEVTADSGRPVARGLGHCLVFPPLDPPPTPPMPPAAEPAADGDTPDPYRRPVDDDARRVGPLTRLLGLDAGPGRCTMPATQWLCPTAPAIQGGSLVMLGQLAAERAAADVLGRPAAVTQVTASFLRMVFPKDAPLTARAAATRHSRNLATVAVQLTDETGRALVEMAATCYDAAPA